MKVWPTDDGGFIGPIKYKLHLKNEKVEIMGFKDMVEYCNLPAACWNSLQDITNLNVSWKIVGK